MTPLHYREDPQEAPAPGGEPDPQDMPEQDETLLPIEGEQDEAYLPPPPYEEEPERRGLMPHLGSRPLWYLAVLALVVLATSWAINQVVRRGLADQYKYKFQDVSLLPADALRMTDSEQQLQVYYLVRGLTLAPYRLKLLRPAGAAERLTLIARALEDAPSGGLLQSPLPPGCKIRGIFLLDNIAWVDLSPEFLKPPQATPQLERLTIYSLVNSVKLNEPSLGGVRFMIGGNPVDSAWGWLDLSSPLGADLSMIR
jgi:hypothetical protein